MPNGEEVLEPQRNTLAAIAAGVLVIIAGFLVYNYFARVGEKTEPEIGQESIALSEDELELPSPEEIVVEEGTTSNEGVEEETATESQPEVAGEAAGVDLPATGGGWAPNDLAPNSVTEGSYTVQFGDTLWEIAEARYGSGFEWGKILEANKDSVGILPNGSQALIEAGQILTLP